MHFKLGAMGLGAGTYFGGCPAGTRETSRESRGIGKGERVTCEAIPKPAPRPAPAPVQKAPETNVTVSPTFQQAFTPQFSPTLQQQQDSPGGTQDATTAQVAPGGQSAEGGSGGANSAELERMRARQAEMEAQKEAADAAMLSVLDRQAALQDQLNETLLAEDSAPSGQTTPVITGGGGGGVVPMPYSSGGGKTQPAPAPPFYVEYRWPIAGVIIGAGFLYFMSQQNRVKK